MFQMQKKKLPSVCQTNCYRSFGFRFGKSLQILLFEGFLRMKGEIMFNNTLTIVISHCCIFTEALPHPIHRSFRPLSSWPRLRFSSHRGEFAAITFGKDKVLPCANGPIVSGGTVTSKQRALAGTFRNQQVHVHFQKKCSSQCNILHVAPKPSKQQELQCRR